MEGWRWEGRAEEVVDGAPVPIERRRERIQKRKSGNVNEEEVEEGENKELL